MRKYEVTLYFHTSIAVEVEANSDEEAIAEAYIEAGDEKYDGQFLHNAQVDGDPDVIVIGIK